MLSKLVLKWTVGFLIFIAKRLLVWLLCFKIAVVHLCLVIGNHLYNWQFILRYLPSGHITCLRPIVLPDKRTPTLRTAWSIPSNIECLFNMICYWSLCLVCLLVQTLQELFWDQTHFVVQFVSMHDISSSRNPLPIFLCLFKESIHCFEYLILPIVRGRRKNKS
jgi:hypothetical protein